MGYGLLYYIVYVAVTHGVDDMLRVAVFLTEDFGSAERHLYLTWSVNNQQLLYSTVFSNQSILIQYNKRTISRCKQNHCTV